VLPAASEIYVVAGTLVDGTLNGAVTEAADVK
jgi:hypothetical protein